jgi:hypothetical protein
MVISDFTIGKKHFEAWRLVVYLPQIVSIIKKMILFPGMLVQSETFYTERLIQ